MIRLDRTFLSVVALAVAVVLIAPSLARAQVVRLSEKSEPRLLGIKLLLQQKGYKVQDVGYDPRENPPAWFAVTAANYAVPSGGEVMQQAVDTWVVISSAIGKAPATLWADEAWSKYVIQVAQTNEKVTAFITAWNAAKTDDERRQAAKIILSRFFVKVYDVERRQYVDVKDFVNKNFTD